MVLAKLPVSWRPSYLNNSLHKSLLHLQKVQLGVVWTVFLSPIIALLSYLSFEDGPI